MIALFCCNVFFNVLNVGENYMTKSKYIWYWVPSNYFFYTTICKWEFILAPFSFWHKISISKPTILWRKSQNENFWMFWMLRTVLDACMLLPVRFNHSIFWIFFFLLIADGRLLHWRLSSLSHFISSIKCNHNTKQKNKKSLIKCTILHWS